MGFVDSWLAARAADETLGRLGSQIVLEVTDATDNGSLDENGLVTRLESLAEQLISKESDEQAD